MLTQPTNPGVDLGSQSCRVSTFRVGLLIKRECTDRRGGGGYNTTDYTDDFSGTSSSTPGVAGVVALMLTVNPKLTSKEVKKLIAESCVKIDQQEGEYVNGHSPFYGHGRLDALIAVQLVKVRMQKPAVPQKTNPFVTAKVKTSTVRIIEALVNRC